MKSLSSSSKLVADVMPIGFRADAEMWRESRDRNLEHLVLAAGAQATTEKARGVI